MDAFLIRNQLDDQDLLVLVSTVAGREISLDINYTHCGIHYEKMRKMWFFLPLQYIFNFIIFFCLNKDFNV